MKKILLLYATVNVVFYKFKNPRDILKFNFIY